MLHVSSNCVTEGKSIEVCLFLTSASARDVIVDLSVDGITATGKGMKIEYMTKSLFLFFILQRMIWMFMA